MFKFRAKNASTKCGSTSCGSRINGSTNCGTTICGSRIPEFFFMVPRFVEAEKTVPQTVEPQSVEANVGASTNCGTTTCGSKKVFTYDHL